MTRRSARCALAVLGLVIFATGCAPEDNPVPTTTGPLDPATAAVKRVVVGAADIEARTYVRHGDIEAADALIFGRWAGARGRALLRFDPESFAQDSLAGSTVIDASLSFNCAPGQGASTGVTVRVSAVGAGTKNAWSAADVAWPGPDLDAAITATTSIDNCAIDDDFPERTIELPNALIERWIATEDDNNGLALDVAGPDAMLQLASLENNLVFVDSLGGVGLVGAARLRFDAARTEGDTVSVFVPAASLESDIHLFAPDSAALPCADPSDCLLLGRGVSHRSIFRIDLPVLPRGSNIHRASLTLAVLGHPRHDDAIAVEVYRLTSEWPDGAPVDSLVTTSGVLWHAVDLPADTSGVDVPITNLVQAWYDGVFENEGLLLRAGREDVDVTAVAFAGVSHSTEGLRPSVEIVYTEPLRGRP